MGWRFGKGKKRAVESKSDSVSTGASSAKRRGFRIVHLQKIVDVLLEYIFLLLMLFGISFWYIDNRYACEKNMLKITRLEKELQDRKFVWLTISADLTHRSRQSEVEKVIAEKNIDLKTSSVPAVKIK